MSDKEVRLQKAMTHPLRLRILGALEHRTASPSELADELDAPLGNVSYHVRQLHGLGLLKLVKETPRRGAVEHYYRLESLTKGNGWGDVPTQLKGALIAGVLDRIGQQVNAAAIGGGFERDESHLQRLPLTLDEQALKEVAEVYTSAIEQIMKIEAAAQERIDSDSNVTELATLAVLMLFEAIEKGG